MPAIAITKNMPVVPERPNRSSTTEEIIMTMLTIIISSVVLLRFGLSGTTGMFFVMAIAGMVCTALSVSGQAITDLKTGYWLGSTPAVQEKVKFLGILASAVAAALTIVLLAKTFQFGEAAPG